ncbi:EpsG family protein [Raoultella ornithinolytica]|nr:EpsG family protein [Raoultella ornithinolytica]ELS5458549.1 EpsG family protein [Raoultella ornithinolytica]ELS5482086.1 EpsG family protein [Raoultella ornithinolytica]MDV1387130.1 EpsG family protein [Raoultella ornithinolytica]HCL6050476.1 EpsG family protein [Raoultella ornithinolytica]
MALYIISMLINSFISFGTIITRDKRIAYLFKILLVIGLSILPAIKSKYVGTDSLMYVGFFSLHQPYSEWLSNGTEPGFVFSIKLIQSLGADNYFYYFFFFSIVFNFLIVSAIFSLSKNIPLSIFVFLSYSALYIFHFNVLRQSMAVAFVLYSLQFLFNKQNIKFYLFVAMASLFHYSALCTLSFPFLMKLLDRKPVLLYVLTLVALVFFSFASNQIYLLLSSATGAARYSNYADLSAGDSSGKLFFLNVFILIFFMFVYFRMRIGGLQNAFFLYLFFTCVVINFCISFLGLRYEGAGRIINYFAFSSIFVFPIVLTSLNPSIRVISYFFTFIFAFSFIVFMLNVANAHGILPYSINPYLYNII